MAAVRNRERASPASTDKNLSVVSPSGTHTIHSDNPRTIFSPTDVVFELESCPPLVTFSVALPSKPTKHTATFVHVEPEPDTVAVPLEPEFSPIIKRPLETMPPLTILTVPVPLLPT